MAEFSVDSVPEYDVVILGAGPTGLAGGLACTDVTQEGFLFDMGGHVIFSHYNYFDQLLDAAIGTGEENWAIHERVSYIWMKKRWVPYPFQNNICALPLEDQIACINGLIEAKVANALARSPPASFDEWIVRVMGEGIADLFMRPYNFKVWAVPPSLMQCGWLGERVATANVARVVENVLRGRIESGWGPNAVFRFPQRGGTGAIWKGVAKLLPLERQRYGVAATALNVDKQTISLSDGTTVRYKKLLSTIPLDTTLSWLGRADLSARLTYSSTHVVGLGIRGSNPHDTKCWLYYPEDDCPFYRCTVFSHYAAENCPAAHVKLPTLRLADGSPAPSTDPEPGPYWSLMFEISESHLKPVNLETILEETIRGALNTELVQPSDQLVSLYHRRLEHGYPTPSLDRDNVLAEALPWLRKRNIWSRGRFGSYKYEVGNQDHSCMIGVEAVDNILFGTKEFTLDYPSLTNEGGAKNTTLEFTL